jgi:hypothetical protein
MFTMGVLKIVKKMRMIIKLSFLSFLTSSEAMVPSPPSLDLLSSIWQSSGPAFQSVYGAPSITNSWGSALVSTNNVLGINAIEMAPFSSGWDANLLYGWPIDTASLYINGMPVTPSATKWTPYSVLRNNSGQFPVVSEVRWVFESQAILFSAEIDLSDSSDNASISVDFQLPMRYYNNANNCSSWHYPTHSESYCWNWFPPEAPSGENGPSFFIPSWQACPSPSNTPFATILQTDSLSSASTAFSFPNICDGGGEGSLKAPTSVNGTSALWNVAPGGVVQLKFALVFSNVSDVSATVAAARSLADSFDIAWNDAKNDWQNRFNSVFDPTLSHFSGNLPIIKTSTGSGGTDGFDSAMEQIYYQSIISLLANERTNLPPSYPSSHDNRLVDYVSESFHLIRNEYVFASRLEKYMKHVNVTLQNGTMVLGSPRVRGSSFSGGGSSSDFNSGKGNSRLLAADHVNTNELLHEAGAPLRMFMTGGGMNATTNIFTWDNQYSAQLHAMLEPLTLSRQLLLWTSSVDVDSLMPSQWSFWGFDYASNRGVGNFYSTNDMTLFELFETWLRVTGDLRFLNKSYTIGPYPNGTNVNTTVYKMMLSLATHWKTEPSFNVSSYLADYGLAANLLECVPSYIHRVASINAANSYMSKTFAKIALSQGDSELAAELMADADGIAKAVLDLYVPSEGYFRARYPNGTEREVRHVMDYVYVSQYLGIENSTDSSGYIPQSIALEMKEFVQRELIVPHWMRALSLNDSAAPLSNRSDHGPSGSYIGWPALVIRSFGLSSSYSDALAFLTDTLFSATLGPYGQAIEIRPPGLPYKPMDVTLYNAMCAAGFGDTIIQTFFGFFPPLVLPGMPQPSTPLINGNTFRGFEGVLYGVRWQGLLWDIESNSNGVSILIEE